MKLGALLVENIALYWCKRQLLYVTTGIDALEQLLSPVKY
jgi:hypothetical protein